MASLQSLMEQYKTSVVDFSGLPEETQLLHHQVFRCAIQELPGFVDDMNGGFKLPYARKRFRKHVMTRREQTYGFIGITLGFILLAVAAAVIEWVVTYILNHWIAPEEINCLASEASAPIFTLA